MGYAGELRVARPINAEQQEVLILLSMQLCPSQLLSLQQCGSQDVNCVFAVVCLCLHGWPAPGQGPTSHAAVPLLFRCCRIRPRQAATQQAEPC